MESAMLHGDIEKHVSRLHTDDPSIQGRALAVLTVLFSRCEDASQLATVAAAVPALSKCLQSEDSLVLANACAALTAAAALDDQLANTISTEYTQDLVSMLQQCCTGGGADLQLNVVSALGQLARDQEATTKALMESQVLQCLLSLANASQPAKLQEAVADCFCALASNDWAKEQLLNAGVVPAAAGLLSAEQIEVSVRCLMVLGMLLPSNAAAQQQLAEDAVALQQLMALLKQNDDADCKILARDVLGVLMRDEGLRSKVEAAIRQQAQDAQAQQQAQ